MSAIYDVDILHIRAEPVRHEVRHRSYLWFVDLDQLPKLPRPLRPLARFEARDHVGDPAQSIRANIDTFLTENGIDLRGGRVTMLASARSLGYVFNPLSLFWCHDPDGTLVCVVAEVHNTYGVAHRYVLHTDAAGRADTEKALYVSPFYPVDGSYRLSVPEPGDRLAVTVTLHRPESRGVQQISGQHIVRADGTVTAASGCLGRRRAATNRALLAIVLRRPFETYVVRALINLHGIRLWTKGLRAPAERLVRLPTR